MLRTTQIGVTGKGDPGAGVKSWRSAVAVGMQWLTAVVVKLGIAAVVTPALFYWVILFGAEEPINVFSFAMRQAALAVLMFLTIFFLLVNPPQPSTPVPPVEGDHETK